MKKTPLYLIVVILLAAVAVWYYVFKGKKNGGAWVYHKTNPGTKQRKEQSKLFARFRTKNKRYTDGVLSIQNKKREGSRKRNFNKSKR